jgi:hypothetical protein
MSISQCTVETKADIYSAWCQALPPLQVAKALRLKPETVITEYVRLDDERHYNPSSQPQETTHE